MEILPMKRLAGVVFAALALLSACMPQAAAPTAPPASAAAATVAVTPTVAPSPAPVTEPQQAFANDSNMYIFSVTDGRQRAYGMMDSMGNTVIEPVYGGLFSMGAANDYLSGQSPAIVRYLKYSDGYAIRGDEYINRLWGAMDMQGNVITECKYAWIDNHADGFAFAANADNSEYYVVNLDTGAEVTTIKTPKYSYVDVCVFAGKTLLTVNGGSRDMIALDERGGIEREFKGYAVQEIYDISPRDEGPPLLAVREVKTDKIGWMDKNLEWVIEPMFTSVSWPDANGIFIASVNNKYGFYDLHAGRWESEPVYDGIWPIKGGLYGVRDTAYAAEKVGVEMAAMRASGVMNGDREIIVPCEYESVTMVNGRLFATITESGEKTDGGQKTGVSVFDTDGNLLTGISCDYCAFDDIEGNKYTFALDREWVQNSDYSGYWNIKGLYMIEIATGAVKDADVGALKAKYEGLQIDYIDMLPGDMLRMNVVRFLAAPAGNEYQEYSTMVTDSDLNTLVEPWQFNYISRLDYASALGYQTAEGPVADMSRMYLGTIHQPGGKAATYTYFDEDFSVMLDNIINPQACDGYRLIARRGFSFGMMDMSGNWIYEESIFLRQKTE